MTATLCSVATPTTGVDSGTTRKKYKYETAQADIQAECARIREECPRAPATGADALFVAMLEWAREQIDSLAGAKPEMEDGHVADAARAIAWVHLESDCGPGVQYSEDTQIGITFRDCCDALRLNCDNARRVFRRYVRRTLSSEKVTTLREYVSCL